MRRRRSTVLGGLAVVLLAAITRDVGDVALWRADRERRARERRGAAEREQSRHAAPTSLTAETTRFTTKPPQPT
ncbi:MAG: hypothetical protein ACRDOD_20370, partial [Streptosporangiaceae bacterium]